MATPEVDAHAQKRRPEAHNSSYQRAGPIAYRVLWKVLGLIYTYIAISTRRASKREERNLFPPSSSKELAWTSSSKSVYSSPYRWLRAPFTIGTREYTRGYVPAYNFDLQPQEEFKMTGPRASPSVVNNMCADWLCLLLSLSFFSLSFSISRKPA